MPRAARIRRRGPGLGAVLVLALIVVPLAEIAVILAVGRAIGGWPTVALLLAESLFGAWLLKREGRTAWRELLASLRGGRMPAAELVDGALVLIGGTLLLTPGFLTDLAGFFCVLPPTRPLARRLLYGAVERRVLASGAWPGGPGSWRGGAPGAGPADPDVIPGEVR